MGDTKWARPLLSLIEQLRKTPMPHPIIESITMPLGVGVLSIAPTE